MTLPVVFTANGQAGYNLTKSLRFRSSASAYLNRTPASAGNRKTWTWSGWVKRGTLGVSQYFFSGGTGGGDTTQTGINFLADNKLNWLGGSGTQYRTTTQVFRDPSAWYHIVLAFDTTLATANDRIKIYVNGTQITAFDNLTNPTQNVDYGVNQAEAHNIGRWTGASGYFDGYLAEVNFIDGQALTPSSFGETSTTTGVWIPKKYTGSYGTNGFYLPFTDTTSTSTLGTDFSGNSNTWTVNNISLTAGTTYDSMTDVPTNTSATTANYAVMNPLRPFGGSLSNGNLTAVTGNSSSANSGFVTSTVWLPTNGKFYFEATPTTVSDIAIGLTTDSNIRAAMYYRNGDIYINGSVTTSQASYTNNDVIGVAVDIGGATVQFYKNNAAQGTAQSISAITAPLVASLAQFSGSSSATAEVNFGQRPFAYTPPTGFVALNTFNLPTPTIGATASSQADNYFNAVTYTGTSGTQAVTGVGFQPDFVWIKNRTSTLSHVLQDAVRGTTAYLVSNATTAENTNTASNWFRSFDSDGFTVATLTSPGGVSTNEWNNTGYNYVSWNWKANGAGSSNTAGSITSTVSANTTAGFSIATFTGNGTSGATIGHGLGVAPSMAIIKMKSAVQNWTVYHASLGNTKALSLDLTDAASTTALFWNNTSPTSSLITLGSGNGVNKNTETYVAYCFTPIAGYSAFGSYTGNGSTDGTFVFTGFRPRYVMIKASSTGGAGYDWFIHDTARDTYNACTKDLEANLSLSEDQYGAEQDFLSNGFKLRNTGGGTNQNGVTYIYMAFAESPFKYANAR
jgi:hypothetical protein